MKRISCLSSLFAIIVVLSPLSPVMADDTSVPMQGSELKLFDGCDDFRGMFFVNAGQQLSGEDGWDQLTSHSTHNFSCGWRQQDNARCQATGFEADSHTCIDNTAINHGPSQIFQTRQEAEAALLNEGLPTMAQPVFIRDPRLDQPEYSNVLIAKYPDNSPIDWRFHMLVFTPAEWWMPQGSRIHVTYQFTPLPAYSPQVIEAAKQHSPPVPSDSTVVTTFLEMLRPAECIIATAECIAQDEQRTLDGMGDADAHFRDLQQQSEEAIRAMQERLREIEAQMMADPDE